MRVTIYCGVPGSGKTTLSKKERPGARRHSADTFFETSDGGYVFDPRLLSEAHARCLRGFVDDVTGGAVNIVVDNTNTTVAEIAPYAALALAYGYELEIVTVLCDPVVAHARNTHGVPAHAVASMAARLSEREMPTWWPTRVVGTWKGWTT